MFFATFYALLFHNNFIMRVSRHILKSSRVEKGFRFRYNLSGFSQGRRLNCSFNTCGWGWGCV